MVTRTHRPEWTSSRCKKNLKPPSSHKTTLDLYIKSNDPSTMDATLI